MLCVFSHDMIYETETFVHLKHAMIIICLFITILRGDYALHNHSFILPCVPAGLEAQILNAFDYIVATTMSTELFFLGRHIFMNA